MTPGYFFRPLFFLPWLYPGLLWRIPVTEKQIFLTFDDGPVPGPTEFVLEQLSGAGAKATFFCIGDNIRKNPSVFRQVVSNGHGIGNHTFNHLSGWKTNDEAYVANTDLCQEAIGSSGNGPKELFRPPYGRIRKTQIEALRRYRIVMWDVLTNDYAKNLSGETSLRESIRATRPGSIVVFHDSIKAEKNMSYVLPRYLDHFGGLGFTFKSIP